MSESAVKRNPQGRIIAWQCAGCGQWWPAYTTLSAFNQHKYANEKHPGEPCWSLIPEVWGKDLWPHAQRKQG